MLKIVFVAFTQHCIQSTVTHFTHVEGVEDTMYSVYSGILPLPGGKAICHSTVFEKPSILGVQRFTTSQSKEAALLTFLDLSNYKGVIAGKMHSQSPILKTKGALSNPVILTDLQTKLHPPYPNQIACL